MWGKFTESARRVVFFAQEEAGRLGTNGVSTEHLLLAIIRDEACVAERVLRRLDISPQRIRLEIGRLVQKVDGRVVGDMVLTPQSKRVMDLAYEESRLWDENFIGTEHILLGLIREGEGIAGRVLLSLGAGVESVRAEVVVVRGLTGAEITSPPIEAADADLSKRSPQPERIRSLNAQLDALRTRLADSSTKGSSLSCGDLGKIKPAAGRAHAEVTLDMRTFERLRAVFEVKDTHGYRAMAEGDQTMFLLPTGTPLKLLAPTDSKAVHDDGFYVRVLSGEYEGYAGWIFKEVFERTGADDAPFPPALKGNA